MAVPIISENSKQAFQNNSVNSVFFQYILMVYFSYLSYWYCMCNDPPSAFTHFCHLRWSIRKRKTQWRGKLTPRKRKKKDNRSCRFPSFIGERDWNNYFEWVNDRILLLLLTPKTHIVFGLSLCCAKQIKQGVRQDKWHRTGMHGSLLNFPLVYLSALN